MRSVEAKTVKAILTVLTVMFLEVNLYLSSSLSKSVQSTTKFI